VSALVFRFLQIALLRANPQDLPAQAVVFWISVALALIGSLAGLSIAYSWGDALIRCVAALVVPAAFFYGVLTLKKMQSRFLQSFSALCGASAIVYFIALPFMPMFISATADTQAGKMIIFFVLMLDIWTVLITAHVIRHTFDVGFASGVSMAIALMIFTLLVSELVLPASSSQVAIGVDGNRVLQPG